MASSILLPVLLLMLVGAFVIGAILFGYVLILDRSVRRLNVQLSELEASLAGAQPPVEPAPPPKEKESLSIRTCMLFSLFS